MLLLLVLLLLQPVLLSHAPIPVQADKRVRARRAHDEFQLRSIKLEPLLGNYYFFDTRMPNGCKADNVQKNVPQCTRAQALAPRDELVEGNLAVVVDICLAYNALHQKVECFGIEARSFWVKGRPDRTLSATCKATRMLS